MALYTRKQLISLYLQLSNSSSLCKPHFLSLFSFSTSAAEKTPITVADYFQQRHQFSADTVAKLISSSAEFIKDPENCDSVLSFFKDSGFSNTQLEHVLKRFPRVISANLDHTIKPKIKILQEVGGLSQNEIAEIITSNPTILWRSCSLISPAICELKRLLGGSNLGLFTVLKKCTWFLNNKLEKSMIPNIEFLKRCGVGDPEIFKFINLKPRIFLFEHGYMKECVERVDQMGLPRDSKMFLYAIWSIGSMSVENWERKLELFRRLGFSEDDIKSAFRRVPLVFSISERKIEEATKVLLSARSDNVSLLVNNPELLIYSVEKRLKPRMRVLEGSEAKNLLVKKPSTASLCKMSSEVFLKKYVLPYSAEVGTIYP